MAPPDFKALALDPIYGLVGVPAKFISPDGARANLTVVDCTTGLDQKTALALELNTSQPGARVRRAEVTAAGLNPDRDLVDGFLTFDGVRWQIGTFKPLPYPGGAAAGELMLILRGA